jgi:hypothetical protein
MLLSVPGGMSLPSFPETVTVPGRAGAETDDGYPWCGRVASRLAAIVESLHGPSCANANVGSRIHNLRKPRDALDIRRLTVELSGARADI